MTDQQSTPQNNPHHPYELGHQRYYRIQSSMLIKTASIEDNAIVVFHYYPSDAEENQPKLQFHDAAIQYIENGPYITVTKIELIEHMGWLEYQCLEAEILAKFLREELLPRL